MQPQVVVGYRQYFGFCMLVLCDLCPACIHSTALEGGVLNYLQLFDVSI